MQILDGSSILGGFGWVRSVGNGRGKVETGAQRLNGRGGASGWDFSGWRVTDLTIVGYMDRGVNKE